MNKKNLYVVKVSYSGLPTFYIVGDETNGSRKKYYLNHKTALNGSIAIIETFILPEGWRDYEVHTELKKLSWITYDGEANEGYLHTRECFYIDSKSSKTEEDFLNEVRRITTGTSRKINYIIRPYQTGLIKRLINTLSVDELALLYSLPRTGKSLMSIVTAILMGYETIVITTPFTSAEDSFREPVVKGKTFTFEGKTYDLEGWRFYNKNNLNEWDGNPQKCVFFLSFALERQKKEGSKFKKFLQRLNKSDATVISIVDEIHNTSDTKLSVEILNTLNADKTLYMSGTPYEDLLVGRFNDKNTVKFDLFDAIEEAGKPENELFFPNMEVYQPYNLTSLLTRFMEKNPEAKDFVCNDYARALSSVKSAEYFVGQMFSKKDENGLVSEDREEELEKMIGNQVLIYADDDFKSKKGKRTPALNLVEALKRASKDSSSYFYGYEIKYADDFKTEDDVNTFQRRHEKTVIVAKQKFTTGVTLKLLDTIILLRSVCNAELFTQIIYRVMTPCEGKNNVSVVVLDAEMELKLIAGFIESRRLINTNDDAEELFKKLKSFITFNGTDLDFQKLSIAEIVSKVNKICAKDVLDIDYRGLGSIVNLTSYYDSLTEDQKAFIGTCKIKATKVGGKVVVLDSPELPSVPEAENEDTSVEDQSEEKKTNKVEKTSIKKEIEKLKTIVSTIPENIFIYKLDTYEKVRDYVPASLKEVEDIYTQFIVKNEKLIRIWLGDIKMALSEIEDEDMFLIENFT